MMDAARATPAGVTSSSSPWIGQGNPALPHATGRPPIPAVPLVVKSGQNVPDIAAFHDSPLRHLSSKQLLAYHNHLIATTAQKQQQQLVVQAQQQQLHQQQQQLVVKQQLQRVQAQAQLPPKLPPPPPQQQQKQTTSKSPVPSNSNSTSTSKIQAPASSSSSKPAETNNDDAKSTSTAGSTDSPSTALSPTLLSFIEKAKNSDRGSKPFDCAYFIEEVKKHDVLCGRGGRSNHHPGNKLYRRVVSEMRQSYRSISEKTTKTDLSRAIVKHVAKYGGRFIKVEKSSGRYYVLTNNEARKKTSQALRECKQLKWVK